MKNGGVARPAAGFQNRGQTGSQPGTPRGANAHGPHACGPQPYTQRTRFLVVTAFGPCVGAATMPPAKRCGTARCRGGRAFALYCRAGPWPRRTDIFSKNNFVIMCGGRKRPPYRARETGNEPGTSRGAHPCREAYMPPLQTPGIASMIPGAGDGGRVTGRMHAAPTNRPGTAGECGGVKTPPYRVAGTGNFPAPPCGAACFRAGGAAMPCRAAGFVVS